jgi:hypothetical protein
MTAQLKHMILGRRSGTLREAKPISNRPAVARRGCVEVDHGLRGPGAVGPRGCGFGGRARAVLVAVTALLALSFGAPVAMGDPVGQVTEFSAGLNPGSAPGTTFPGSIAAGPDGNLWFTDPAALAGGTSAIRRITPSGQITEFSSGLNPGSAPASIALGADGNLWFTDPAALMGGTSAIGRITQSGQINEYSSGLNTDSFPTSIASGPDGNLWFTDRGTTSAIVRIGTGAPSALQSPGISGAGRTGSAESCQAQWPVWAGYGPMAGLYPFDGYAWLRDGSPIAGQTTPAYTPTAVDVGHQIACRATVTYPLPFQVTANATSPAITVRAALPPPPPPTPALSALNVSPRRFTLRGRRVGGRCQPATRSNRRHHPCARRATLTVRFTLTTTAAVTFAIERALPGRLTRSGCTAPTRNDRRHRRCTRLVTLPGTIALAGVAGVTRSRSPA